MAEPVKYVSFGGAQVPESAKREVIDRNGQKIYCVWTDDKGGNIAYPEQHTSPTSTIYYVHEHTYSIGFNRGLRTERETIPKYKFEAAYREAGSTPPQGWHHYRHDGILLNDNRYAQIGHSFDPYVCDKYHELNLDTTPRIEVSTDSGMIYDTQNITLSNMRGATVTGSTDEDNITLTNSSKCTIDVSNANNNMFVSDNVKVVNGQGNKVKAGDHDQVTFRTFNCETATETTKANHKGEGTYKQ